jgi:hypothetical protein
MQTLATIEKTDLYNKRKDFNKENPDNQAHIDMCSLIDDLIKVAIHMKKIIDLHKDDKDVYDFRRYVNGYGITYDGHGILQTHGVYHDNVMKPFIEWSDTEQTTYTLRQANVLKSVFESLSDGSEDIVGIVEGFDLWYNS